jgi:DMSO/TMAO reductase YedYZ molybdopterin-dependent catalytic subunit
MNRFRAVHAPTKVWAAALVAGLVFGSAAGGAVAQRGPAGPTTLAVSGNVATPLTLSVDDLKAMPRTRVEVKDSDRTRVYDGVLVVEILRRAGVPLGTALRGEAMASYVVASARDDYRVVFSLAELDPAFLTNDVIVADTLDGAPLPVLDGPLRIVAPREARAARSVRMLEGLRVVRLEK